MELLNRELLTTLWNLIMVVTVLYTAYQAIQAFTGRVLALSRTQRLTFLKNWRAWLQRLHKCNHVYYEYLLSGILWVLFLFTWQLMIEGLVVSLTYQSALLQQIAGLIQTLTRYTVGWLAGLIAFRRLVCYRKLQYFDRTMATLNRRIAKVEAKMGLQPEPAGV